MGDTDVTSCKSNARLTNYHRVKALCLLTLEYMGSPSLHNIPCTLVRNSLLAADLIRDAKAGSCNHQAFQMGEHLDKLHAAVKVSVNGKDEGAVGNGLHQLCQTDLVRRQEHYGGNARMRTVCRKCRRCVTYKAPDTRILSTSHLGCCILQSCLIAGWKIIQWHHICRLIYGNPNFPCGELAKYFNMHLLRTCPIR